MRKIIRRPVSPWRAGAPESEWMKETRTMKNHNLITAILAAATVAAVPALAAADHRDDAGWTKLGEVGTHANDVEDFVPIDSVPITRVQPRDELRFNWHGGVYVRIN